MHQRPNYWQSASVSRRLIKCENRGRSRPSCGLRQSLRQARLQQVIDTNKRIAELSVRIANEAAGIIQAQANQNAKQVRRVA
jgi:hypothetical protein